MSRTGARTRRRTRRRWDSTHVPPTDTPGTAPRLNRQRTTPWAARRGQRPRTGRQQRIQRPARMKGVVFAGNAVAQAARRAGRLAKCPARNGMPPPTVVVTGHGNGAMAGNRARHACETGIRWAEAVRAAVRAEISRLTTVDIPVHPQSAGRDIVAASSGHDDGRQPSVEEREARRGSTTGSILTSMDSASPARSLHQRPRGPRARPPL